MEQPKKIVLLSNKIEPPSFHQHSDSGDMFLLVIFQTDMLFSYDGSLFFKVPANSFILYRPHSLQDYKSASDKMQNSFIYIDYEEKYFANLGIPINTIVVLKKEEVERLVFKLDRLSYIVNTPYAETLVSEIPTYVDELFGDLAIYAKNAVSNVNGNTLNSVLLNIRGSMFNNPIEYTVKKMAYDVGFTETYFGIKYKELFGVSPSQDRKKQIVEIIKQYLINTDYSLDQIADLCSIKSTAHLINTFKSIEHITPHQYRKLKNGS